MRSGAELPQPSYFSGCSLGWWESKNFSSFGYFSYRSFRIIDPSVVYLSCLHLPPFPQVQSRLPLDFTWIVMKRFQNSLIHSIAQVVFLLCLSNAAFSQNFLAKEQPEPEQQPEFNKQSDGEFFEKKVRPLLVAKCLECHSQESEINGGLSLDSKADWSTGGDSGPAIQVEAWEKSLLWTAVDYRNPKLQMPPDSRLSESERDTFRVWLSGGAFDPRISIDKPPRPSSTALSVAEASKHWAYRPVPTTDTAVPDLQSDSTNAIDYFLAVQQSELGIVPNGLAGIDVLRQRLSLDLHGLKLEPGTNVSVSGDRDPRNDAEMDDESYSLMVDAFLASPRFGERMARRWMDVVRFAESITLRGFILHDAWRYRNYLIDSFQRDKPFDTFVREQVAGDLIQTGSLAQRQEQLIATTMLALGDTNLEEQDKKQLEMDYIDEQLDVLGKVFLAQTVGCARCHDHKFDPIPTSDYYALAGILKSSVAIEHANVSKWVRVPLPLPPEEELHFASLVERQSETQANISKAKKILQSGKAAGLVVQSEDLSGVVVDDKQAKQVGIWRASTSVKAYVGDGYLHDDNDSKGQKSITFEPPSLPPGTYRVRLSYNEGAGRSKEVMVRVFSADGEDLIRVDQTVKPSDDGLWKTLGTYRFEPGGQAFVIVSNDETVGHVVADAVQFLPETDATADAESVVTSDSDASLQSLRSEVAKLDLEAKEMQAELDKRPMAMSIRPLETPADIAIHVRGSVHQQGRTVPRGFLSCVPVSQPTSISVNSNGRLELADWMVNPENPLTARVYVNRVWAWMMGDGIVRTIDNFGTTGELPGNEPLLNWLTHQFIANGWSTKWLVREIALSKAYRRSSKSSVERMQLDPDNRCFARAYVRRLDAESLRDSLLSLSGELDLGPGTQSTIPEKIKDDFGYQHTGTQRSVYGPWFRNALPEMYSEFDGANPCFPISKRARSTIAPQALALLNSPWVAERANRFAERIITNSENPTDHKLNECFGAVLGRLPSEQERAWAHGRLGSNVSSPDLKAWSGLVHDLIASLDFRFIE